MSNPNSNDFYEVLGISRSASKDEIKKAYRSLARKHHPDRNQGDKASEETFKKVQEAYDVLSDAQKKTAYDQYGKAGIDPNQMGGGFGGAGMGGFGDINDILNNVFDDYFGGGGFHGGHAGNRPRRGGDLIYRLELSLEDAVAGYEANVEIPAHQSGAGGRAPRRF